MIPVSKKIQLIYETTGLNANSLAKKIGVTPSYIYKLEKGASDNPSMEFLISLEDRAGINMKWFSKDEGEMLLKDVKSTSDTPLLWEDLKSQMERSLEDKDKLIKSLEVFQLLYCKEKGVNFLDVSEMPPVVPMVVKTYNYGMVG